MRKMINVVPCVYKILCVILAILLFFYLNIHYYKYAIYMGYLYKIDLQRNHQIFLMRDGKQEDIIYIDNHSIEYEGKKSTYEIINKKGSYYDIDITLPSGKTSSVINFSSADVKLFCSSYGNSSTHTSSEVRDKEQVYRDIVISALMVRLAIISVYKKIKWITVFICVAIGISSILYYRNRRTILIQ